MARTAHLPGFRYDAETRRRLEIVAAADADPRAADGADLPCLTDWQRLLETVGTVDFVDICTPTASHVSGILWALREGYHVLCEKPAALTLDEAREIGDAARAASRTVMACHQYRFNPAWRQMRQWIADGVIGDWHLAELSVYRPAADGGAGGSAVPWRGTRAEGGGGILLDHGTHLLYTLCDLAGLPAAVQAWTGRLRHHAYDVEDTVQLTLAYPNRLATLLLTWSARHRENRVRFIGARGTIEWVGGVLRCEAEGRPTETFDMTAQLDKRAYASWFAALFRSFADALDAGGVAESPLADIANVAEVLDAAYRAAASGCRVALPSARGSAP